MSDYKELPCGYYNVKVESCDDVITKAGNPAVLVKARVQDGEHKGRVHFIYQLTTSEIGLKIANEYRKLAYVLNGEVIRLSKYERERNGKVFTNYRFYPNETQEAKLA